MNIENKTMASEIIAMQGERMKEIIFELDSTVDDFLEKGKFALTELMELIDEMPQNSDQEYAFTYSQKRMNMFVHIAFDYLCQAQTALNEIVVRERREQQEG